MGEDGVTLIELITVICIIAILSAIGTLRFYEYADRAETDKQTRMMYEELLNARLLAMNQGRSKLVRVNRSYFEVYSSTVDTSHGAQPLQRFTLKQPVTFNNGSSIVFDARGLADTECSVCVADDSNPAGADSIVIARTRVRIGKRSAGKDCQSDSVSRQ